MAPVVAARVDAVPTAVPLADPATVSISPSTSTAAPHVAGPVLDGTYRVDFDLQNQTINGTVTGLATTVQQWWAFRSVCTPAGCVAAGSELDESNQQEGNGATTVLRFADGHWQGAPILRRPRSATAQTSRSPTTRRGCGPGSRSPAARFEALRSAPF